MVPPGPLPIEQTADGFLLGEDEDVSADEDWRPSRNSWPHPDDFWP